MEGIEEESFIDDERRKKFEDEGRKGGAGAERERPDSPHPKGMKVRRGMGG